MGCLLFGLIWLLRVGSLGLFVGFGVIALVCIVCCLWMLGASEFVIELGGIVYFLIVWLWCLICLEFVMFCRLLVCCLLCCGCCVCCV